MRFLMQFCLTTGSESLWEKLSVWYHNSIFYELFEYFNEKYFTVEFGAYENFSVGAGVTSLAQTIVYAIALGVILAAAMSVYTRSVLGGFVRTLIKEGADSPENAKKLSQLGFFRNAAIRRELAKGVTLRKVVRCCEEEAFLAEQESKTAETAGKGTGEMTFRPNFLTARYYIPEDLRYRAEIRFEKKGSGWGLFLGASVIAILLAAVIGYFLPDIVQLMDNIIGMMTPKA
ncbi:MAG: hypothetical protein IJX19_12645 [Clostridia bacterium]|nr:hypothetical protein [Clostridia bacterium]